VIQYLYVVMPLKSPDSNLAWSNLHCFDSVVYW